MVPVCFLTSGCASTSGTDNSPSDDNHNGSRPSSLSYGRALKVTDGEDYLCGIRPSETQAQDLPAITMKKEPLRDPDSVLIRNIQEPICVLYQDEYQWVIRFEYNAKNAFGAYTGYEPFAIYLKSEGAAPHASVTEKKTAKENAERRAKETTLSFCKKLTPHIVESVFDARSKGVPYASILDNINRKSTTTPPPPIEGEDREILLRMVKHLALIAYSEQNISTSKEKMLATCLLEMKQVVERHTVADAKL